MDNIVYRHGIAVPHGAHYRRNVVIASDHRGYTMKREILNFLKVDKINVTDIGTHSHDKCDYPQISWDLGRMISQDTSYNTVGIGICGSGVGIGIPASKWPGVYHARCINPDEAIMSREHNNSNLLTLGADELKFREAIRIVDAWIKEPFYPNDPYLSRFIQTVELEQTIPAELGLEKKIMKP